MNNSRYGRRQTKRRGCRRNRKQSGGNTGQSYSVGGSVVPGIPNLGNGAMVVPQSSCGNATPYGGLLNVSLKGLPGLSGGRRSSSAIDPAQVADMLKAMGGQIGGRYSVGAEVVGPSAIAFAPVKFNGHCEGASSRGSMNPVQPLLPSSPMHGGATMQLGTAPVGGMVYEAPNAGYTFAPSTGSGGAGSLADGKTPFAVHVPYTAQPTASGACLKTGGRRRRNRNRKSRKASACMRKRKNRRNTRRN